MKSISRPYFHPRGFLSFPFHRDERTARRAPQEQIRPVDKRRGAPRKSHPRHLEVGSPRKLKALRTFHLRVPPLRPAPAAAPAEHPRRLGRALVAGGHDSIRCPHALLPDIQPFENSGAWDSSFSYRGKRCVTLPGARWGPTPALHTPRRAACEGSRREAHPACSHP